MTRHFSLRGSLAIGLMGTLLAAPLRADSVDTPPVEATSAVQTAPGLVYVIPVQEMIERGLLYAFQRGLQAAKDAKADAIILDMDTPGGRLDTAEQMVLMLLQSKIRTYTFVNPRAISAGAIIAFATDEIYMTSVGLIGDAMPIMMSPLPMGGPQAVPADLKEKVMSPTIALMRSAAQAKGHDQRLGDAMIRPEAGYTIGETTICPTGQLLTLTAQDAIRPLREGNKPLLAAGIVSNMDELIKTIGHENSRVVRVEITAAERIARVIEGFPFSSILLALGLLGLYIEFKAPGLGFPGIAGMVCLAVWFWGHHIAGLTGIMELLLFSVGAVLLLMELFLIPGFGFTGAAGILLMASAILLSMVHLQPMPVPADLPELTFPELMWRRGITNLGLAIVLTGGGALLLARWLPQTSLFQRIMLTQTNSRAAGYAAPGPKETLLGKRGTAITPLRPAGMAELDGARVNVVARGTFIEKGTPIVVAEAHGNRIIVDTV